MIFSLLLSLCAHAEPWKPVWEAKFEQAPRAAFFDAASGSIFVSTDGAKLFPVSLQGEVAKKPTAERRGQGGAIRAYGGRIYWAVGERIFSLEADGTKMKEEAQASAPVWDLALDAKGKLFVASEKGWGEPGKEAGKPVSGLFSLAGEITALREGVVEAGKITKKLCKTHCHGLERAPTGEWIRVEGGKILRGKDVLAKTSSTAGRIGYVYRKESEFDLLLVPYFKEKKLVAYQREKK